MRTALSLSVLVATKAEEGCGRSVAMLLAGLPLQCPMVTSLRGCMSWEAVVDKRAA